MTTSPATIRTCAIAARTDSGVEPRCTGMCAACATMSPALSKRAHEKSRRSLMLGENALRHSATPISSAMALRRWLNTSNVIGSIGIRQFEMPAGVDAATPARRNDRSRTRLSNDRGPTYASPDRELRARVDRASEPAACPMQPRHTRLAGWKRAKRGTRQPRTTATRQQTYVDDLDWPLAVGVAVQAPVRRVKSLGETQTEWHPDFVRLALVAHVQGADKAAVFRWYPLVLQLAVGQPHHGCKQRP